MKKSIVFWLITAASAMMLALFFLSVHYGFNQIESHLDDLFIHNSPEYILHPRSAKANSSDLYNSSKAPYIGILTMPAPRINPMPGKAIIPACYVKWLEAAGAIVVPVPFNLPEKQLDLFFKNLNGLMITGGRSSLFRKKYESDLLEVNLTNITIPGNEVITGILNNVGNITKNENNIEHQVTIENKKFLEKQEQLNNPESLNKNSYSNKNTTTLNTINSVTAMNSTLKPSANTTDDRAYRVILTKFARTIHFFVNKSIEATKNGDHFPIFGVCLGLEGIISRYEKDLNNRQYLRRVNLSFEEYLDGVGVMTEYLKTSKMFSGFSDIGLLKERIFFYHHIYCIDYDNVMRDLSHLIRPLSYFFDESGKRYITSLEFIDYPFYGIQFHPEKISYEWKVEINRTKEAITAAFDLIYPFVQECKKSPHTFNQSLFNQLTIYRFPTSDNSSIYNSVYAIPFKYHQKFFQKLSRKNTSKPSKPINNAVMSETPNPDNNGTKNQKPSAGNNKKSKSPEQKLSNLKKKLSSQSVQNNDDSQKLELNNPIQDNSKIKENQIENPENITQPLATSNETQKNYQTLKSNDQILVNLLQEEISRSLTGQSQSKVSENTVEIKSDVDSASTIEEKDSDKETKESINDNQEQQSGEDLSDVKETIEISMEESISKEKEDPKDQKNDA